MGAICNIFSKISRRDGGSSNLSNPAKWLVDWCTGGYESSSGVSVTADSALKHTPFWAAVRIISGTVAHLPFIVYERLEDGKNRLPKHPVYKLMHDRPNPYMDALTFIETRQAHVLTYGNGYAEIQRDGGGRPVALWPLLPDRTERKISDTGIPYYEVRLPVGGSVFLRDENVLHIKGLGFDGYTGYDVVNYHKEAIGYGVAVKQYGARFFGNDASPGGVLEHPQTLGKEAQDRLVESWNKSHQGLSQSHRLQILEEGMKFTKIGIDPAQAQALEVQKWTVDDCSRIFQIPPHKLGSMEFSKYNNVEQLQLDFVATTMLYWFRKWELECNYKLFMPSERDRLFCEILVDGLVRGDMASRYAAYNIGRNAGFLCADDIREKENMNPLPDGKGKIFLEPLNMKEAGTVVEVKPKEPVPEEDDDIRAAHWSSINSQWSRIITKQLKSKGKNGFWSDHRDWAAKVLFNPVNAWAAFNGVSVDEAKSILSKVVEENLHENRRIGYSDAGSLTDLTMERIGGDHA